MMVLEHIVSFCSRIFASTGRCRVVTSAILIPDSESGIAIGSASAAQFLAGRPTLV